jgi:hypothetical protein
MGGLNVSKASPSDIGAVRSLWRYPVKSMMGEALSLTQVTVHGFLGDRIYAILDSTDGKVARAKNPKKWPNLFAFQASLQEPEGKTRERCLTFVSPCLMAGSLAVSNMI